MYIQRFKSGGKMHFDISNGSEKKKITEKNM